MKIDHNIEIVDANAAELGPCPIDKNWILEGNPVARIKVLSKAADGTAATIMWDCTAGKFNWFYAMDETVYFLEGSVTLKDHRGPRLVKAGESVFFPKGSSAEWNVESYIKKGRVLPGASARNVGCGAQELCAHETMGAAAARESHGGDVRVFLRPAAG